MHGFVIDIRALTLGNIVPIPCRFWRLPEMLLLIADEVLGASDDTRALNALDCFGDQDTGQDRIRAKLFVSTTVCVVAKTVGLT